MHEVILLFEPSTDSMIIPGTVLGVGVVTKWYYVCKKNHESSELKMISKNPPGPPGPVLPFYHLRQSHALSVSTTVTVVPTRPQCQRPRWLVHLEFQSLSHRSPGYRCRGITGSARGVTVQMLFKRKEKNLLKLQPLTTALRMQAIRSLESNCHG